MEKDKLIDIVEITRRILDLYPDCIEDGNSKAIDEWYDAISEDDDYVRQLFKKIESGEWS